MKKLLFVIVFCLIAQPLYAATRTVGSGKTHATIQACVDVADPGDTCLVYEGTYAGNVTFTTSGTDGNQLIVEADTGGTQPVISGVVDFASEDYITIDGFKITSALTCDGCTYIQILDNLIEKTGIGIEEIAPGYNILIDGNTFDLTAATSFDVIRPWGGYWVIRNNTAINLNDTEDSHLDFIQTWCDLEDQSNEVPCDFILAENNLYANNQGDGNVHFFLIHSTDGCNEDRTNYIIRYNKVRYIDSSFMILDDDDSANDFLGAAVYNNTIGETFDGIHVSWRDYTIDIDGTYLSANNNIMYDAVDPEGAEGVVPNTVSFGGSLVYDPGNTITDDGALDTCLTAGTCTINDNPDFSNYAANNFTLQSDSSAIDHGVHLTTVAAADISSGESLIVDDSYPFQAGWSGTDADWICVGATYGAAECMQISSINYGTNTITVADFTREDGDKVWLYKDSDGTQVIFGDAPDAGAEEYDPLSQPISGTLCNGCYPGQ
jgi:hypothetical protein